MIHYKYDKEAQDWVCNKEPEHKITWKELAMVFVVSALVLFGTAYALDNPVTWVS